METVTMWRRYCTVVLFGVVILIGIAIGYWADSDEQAERIKELLALVMIGLGLLAALLYGFAHVVNHYMKRRTRKDTSTAVAETAKEKELP